MNRLSSILIAVAAGGVLAGGGLLLEAEAYQDYAYVFPNVTCESRDLGGMTREEAGSVIAALLEEKEFYVDLRLPDGQVYRITPVQTVSEHDPGAALEAAWDYGREDSSFFGPVNAYRQSAQGEREIPLVWDLRYDRADVAGQVSALLAQAQTEPTPCTGSLDEENHTAVIQIGKTGRTFDPEAVTELVCTALDRQETSLDLSYTEIPLDTVQLDSLLAQLAAEGNREPEAPYAEWDQNSEAAVLHMGLPGYRLNTKAARAMVYGASRQGETSVAVPWRRPPRRNMISPPSTPGSSGTPRRSTSWKTAFWAAAPRAMTLTWSRLRH